MSPRWSAWSAWTWDDAQARYWRARQDTQGNVEYDFATPRGGNVDDLAESFNNVNLGGHEDPTYTQTDAYTHGSQIAADGSATASAYSTPYAQPQPTYPAKGKGKSKAHHKEGHRDKGSSKKHRPKPAKNFDQDSPEGPVVDELSPFYRRKGGAPSEPVPVSSAAYTSQPGYAESAYGTAGADPRYGQAQTAGVDPRYGQAQTAGADPRYGQAQSADADSRYDQESSTYSNTEPQSTSPGQYDRHDYRSGSGSRLPGSVAEDESTYPEQHGRHGYAHGTGGRVPESTAAQDSSPEEHGSEYYSETSDSLSPDIQDAVSQVDAYLTGSVDDLQAAGETSSMASAHPYPYPTYEPDGRETPRPYAQPATAPNFYQPPASAAGSTGTGGEADIHSVSCVVEPSSKFRPGEVFKIMWCEPRGGGAPNRSEILTQRMRVDHGTGSIYQGLRRFIVVANDEGHCTCVPILTYERQGCNKRGVKPLKHGIVYQSGKRARPLQGEPQLGFEPVRVHLNERTEQLVKESRVNYAKLTTIEHNFPVFFIGRVDPADFQNIVRPAVDTCWQRKRHTNY